MPDSSLDMTRQSDSSSRSFLFVSGSQPERFDKALASGADAVILDLEDAVAPADKDAARKNIANWVSAERPVLVRVNANGTSWFEDDARLGTLRGVAGIVLPKAESRNDIVSLISIGRIRKPVYPLIESAKGMWNALAVAQAPSVRQLIFGTLDFCVDMNMEHGSDELSPYRAKLVLTSRIAGILPPVDGVTTSIHDEDLLLAETLGGKRRGFAGKLCIHPKQVAAVNRCYTPEATQVEWAKRVITAFETSAGAAVAVDGKMVDRPVVLLAQSILRRADSAQ